MGKYEIFLIYIELNLAKFHFENVTRLIELREWGVGHKSETSFLATLCSSVNRNQRIKLNLKIMVPSISWSHHVAPQFFILIQNPILKAIII